MKLLLTSMIALLLLYAAGVLVVHVIVFFLALRLFHIAKFSTDGSDILLLSPDEEAHPDDLEFLLQCHEEGQQLGLVSLGDFELMDVVIRTVISCWEVPGTDLAVSHAKYQPVQNAKLRPRIVKEAHNRSSAGCNLGVTTNALSLLNSKIEQPAGSVLVVRPTESPTTELIGIAWAVAANQNIPLTTTERGTDYEAELRNLRSESSDRAVKAKVMKQDQSGDLRYSVYGCLLYSVSALPIIMRTKSYLHTKKSNRIYAAAEHLLPIDRSDSWIIAAVQDRVRTGSTAPLTQP
ncbi:MAG: hypothetical protein ACF8MJ_11310 [Phycisphaerales bacterium JB050]